MSKAYIEIIREDHVYRATVHNHRDLLTYCSTIKEPFRIGAIQLSNAKDQGFTDRLLKSIEQISLFGKYDVSVARFA